MRSWGIDGPRLLILLAAAIGFPGAGAAADLRLAYDIGIEPGSREIPVSVRVEGIEADSLRIRLTADYGGIADYYTTVGDLRVDGEPLEPPGSWVVLVPTAGKDSLTISYRLHLSGFDRSRGRTLPMIDATHAFIPGASTLIYPDQAPVDEVRVRFTRPEDWGLATSWGVGDTEYRFNGSDLDELIYSFSVAGDYRFETTRFDDVEIHTAFRGDGVSDDDDVRRFLLRVLDTHRDTFGMIPFRRLLVVGNFFYENGVTSGNAFHNSINLVMPRDRRLSDHVAFRNLIAHESFHLWSGGDGLLGYRDYDVLWVSEGVTDYYAQKNLLRAGLISEEEMLAELAGKYRRLNASFLRGTSLREAGNRYFEDSRARNLVYTKGALAGFLIDTYLGSKGETQLDDVMRNLARNRNNAERGELYGYADVLEALNDVGGAELVTLLQRFSGEGYRGTLEGAMADAGYRIERIAEEGYSLGIFDAGDPGGQAAVRALDREGPAWVAGVRENDVVVELAGIPIPDRGRLEEELRRISNGNGDDVRLIVRRGTEQIEFLLRPEGFYRYRFTRSVQ